MKKASRIPMILMVGCSLLIMTGCQLGGENPLVPKSQSGEVNESNIPIENTIDTSLVSAISKLQGVTRVYHFDGENNLIIAKTTGDIEEIDDQASNEEWLEYTRKSSGRLYKVDVNQMITTEIMDGQSPIYGMNLDIGAGVSPNGRYISMLYNERFHIYDTKEGTKALYNTIEHNGAWSQDSNAMIVWMSEVTFGNKKLNGIVVYDTQGNPIKKQPLEGYSIAGEIYSKDGNQITFIGESVQNERMVTGLYTMDMNSGQISNIIEFNSLETWTNESGETIDEGQNYIISFKMVDDQRIIFYGYMKSKVGLYTYTIGDSGYETLIEDDTLCNYSPSPDGRRIVYATSEYLPETPPQKGMIGSGPTTQLYNSALKQSILVANIIDGKLDDISYLKKDVSGIDYYWSNDSSTFYFLENTSHTIQQVTFKQ